MTTTERRVTAVLFATCLATGAANVAAAQAETQGQDQQALSERYYCGYGPGYRMGPGYGTGPGMMGGYGWGHHGTGPRMSGGYGRTQHGVGPGMMSRASLAPFFYLTLSDEQRARIDRIADELRRKNWEIAGRMQDQAAKMRDLYYSAKRDRAAISAAYKQMRELRQQMLDNSLDAYERAEALLTPEQSKQFTENRHGYPY